MIHRSALIAKLNTIHDPCSVASGRALGLDDMGLIESVEADEHGVVSVDIRLTAPSCLMIGYFVTEIRKCLLALEGVSEVRVTHDLGDRWEPASMAPHVLAERRQRFESLRRQLG